MLPWWRTLWGLMDSPTLAVVCIRRPPHAVVLILLRKGRRLACRERSAMDLAKVLLVEDDQRFCEVIELFFSETFEIRRARTGDEALGVLSRERVGAVLLDYRLPGRLNGLDVLATIRSRHPRLPVIMMTGYGSELLVASAMKLGISDYFSKPVSVDEVFQSLKKILSP